MPDHVATPGLQVGDERAESGYSSQWDLVHFPHISKFVTKSQVCIVDTAVTVI